MNEDFVEAVPLATTEDVSSIEVIHEATPEAGKDSLETTIINTEPQQEHEVVPDTLEPEISPIKTEVEVENQIKATSMETTDGASINVEVQPDPSLSETAPQDIEAQTQVDDTSNIKDEPIPESDTHIEAAGIEIEGPLEVPASSTKESQSTTQLEPEVKLVAPAEEEPSVIAQVEAGNLLSRIESEDVISQGPGEAIPTQAATTSVANVEDQIVAPVDIQLEHSTMVETSSTDELVEVTHLPIVEERPETLAPAVEPSYKSSDVGVAEDDRENQAEVISMAEHIEVKDIEVNLTCSLAKYY